MTRVLFICTHNSARSQMAEAYMNLLGGGDFVAESAGLEPGTLNPHVVEAMREQGVDISGATTRSVFETFKGGKLFNYIITVCADAESKCPIYPGIAQRMHVPLPRSVVLHGHAGGNPCAGSRGPRRYQGLRHAIRAKWTREYLGRHAGPGWDATRILA